MSANDIMGSIELPINPEIITKEGSISIKKDDGTKVSYFIFPEFEVHDNVLSPGLAQNWHYHKKIEEIIFVTDGEIEILWLDKLRNKVTRNLKKGDLCRLGSSVHNVANNTKKEATFIVYRHVPTGKNHHELIKGDRYPVDINN